MSIGNRLSELRKVNHMTQEEFAKKYHVTRQTVSNWENDKHYPDMGILKQISDEYGISFDELFKDDNKYIENVDSTKKKMSTLKKIMLGLAIIIVALIVSFIFAMHYAFQGTPDKNRITTDTDVRMYVGLNDSSFSSAITRSYRLDEFNGLDEYKRMDIRSGVAGTIEGDVPYVGIDTKEESRVEFHFQDNSYVDIQPEIQEVKLYTAPGMPAEAELRTDKQLDLSYRQGTATVYLSDVLDKEELTFYEPEENETDEPSSLEPKVWFCIFEIYYHYNGVDYVSLTAVAV